MNEYHIRKIIRDELKLRDKFTKLKEEVDKQSKGMWKALYDTHDDGYYDNEELNKLMKKSAEHTYDMYKGWYDDAVKALKEFEIKEYD